LNLHSTVETVDVALFCNRSIRTNEIISGNISLLKSSCKDSGMKAGRGFPKELCFQPPQ